MRKLSLWLVIGVTCLLLATVSVFSFAQIDPALSPAANAVSDQAAPATGNVAQGNFAAREQVYQQQIAQLNQALADHQKAYQAQIQTLTTQIANAQKVVQTGDNQLQVDQQQVAGLTSVRNDNLAQYQSQLQALQQQYDERYSQILAQIAEVQTKLDQAQQTLSQ